MSEPTSAARSAPAAERNRAPIIAVLREVLPARGDALELASGTGQHAAAFAAAFPGLRWQPSDPDPAARTSIDAWCRDAGLDNLLPARAIDVHDADWQVEPVDVMACINMIHIAPWSACEGLMAGAGRYLRSDGLLYLYGPYRRDGAHTAPSNEAFDDSLRRQNPDWGVRDLEAVADAAAAHGLRRQDVVAMPANNFSVIFRKA